MDLIFVVLLMVGMLYSCVFFYKWFFGKAETIKRILKNVETKRIRDVVNGEVTKVAGEVRIIGKPLIAPLSKRECGYYYVLIEEHQRTGFSNNWSWVKIVEEEVAGNFLIKDGRHYARLNSKKVKSHIVQDRNYSSGLFKDASDDLKQYLHDHGWNAVDLFGFNLSIRYKEGVLENGEMVTVMAKAEWQLASQFNLPQSYGKILAMNATDELSIYLSDDPAALSEDVKLDFKNRFIGKL
jgi:hypothetical protein